MKNTLFLMLALLPTLLFAQQDSTKQTFVIGECRASLNGIYHDKDTVPISEIQWSTYITINCGKVISFDIRWPIQGTYGPPDHFEDNCIDELSDAGMYNTKLSYVYVIFENIKYKTNSGQLKYARGITIRVKR